jgi:hypothetical protein
MPETAIGFFPDLGACLFLSGAPCGLGKLVILSGRRLHGRELLWAGIATHYIPSSRLSALEDALFSTFNAPSTIFSAPDGSSEAQCLHTIDRVLSSFQEVCRFTPPCKCVDPQACFSKQLLQEILPVHRQPGTYLVSQRWQRCLQVCSAFLLGGVFVCELVLALNRKRWGSSAVTLHSPFLLPLGR